MKNAVGFLVAILLGPMLWASTVDFQSQAVVSEKPSQDLTEVPAEFSQKADIHRKTNLLVGLIDDQPVVLEGIWDEESQARLRVGVGRALVSREARFAETSEMGLVHSLHFRIGSDFFVKQDRVLYISSSGSYPSHESGRVETVIFIPEGASSEAIGNYLDGKLPEYVIRDEKRLAAFRQKIQGQQKHGICNYLLSFIRN